MPNPEIHALESGNGGAAAREIDARVAGGMNRSVPGWLFRGACAVLTALYLSAALYHISDLPFPDPDEPRYAGAGRAMANGASLLVPEFNGEPRINKPPLFYWLVALSVKLAGGATEGSSRAPSVVMGLFMLWGTVWLGRKFFGATAGLLAGLILATTPLFMALSRCCITDMTLSTFLAGTLGCLMLGMLGLAPLKKAGWIATLLFGLSFLTKSVPAFAVVLCIVIQRAIVLPKERRPAAARWLAWMLAGAIALSAGALLCDAARKSSAKHAKAAAAAAREAAAEAGEDFDEDAVPANASAWGILDGVLNKCALALAVGVVAVLLVMAYRSERAAPALPPGWKPGLVISVSMVLWWYALLIVGQGWPRFWKLLSFELFGRIDGTVHREGMHYYLLLLPAVTFPWSPGLVSALGMTWTAQAPVDESPHAALERRADTFLLAWLLGIVFFFSIPGAKLPTYILPAMPAAALLTARFLIQLTERLRSVGRRWIWTTQSLALVFALALLLFPLYLRWLPKDIHDAIFVAPATLWIVSIGAALMLPGSWLLAVRGRGKLAALIAGGGTFLLIFLAAPYIINGLKPRSSKQLCLNVKDALKDCKQLKSMGVAPEGISYYLDTPVEKLKWKPPAANERGTDLLAELLAGGKPMAVFVDKRFVPRFLGGRVELNRLTVEQLKRALPAGVFWVYSDQNVLVVRN